MWLSSRAGFLKSSRDCSSAFFASALASALGFSEWMAFTRLTGLPSVVLAHFDAASSFAWTPESLDFRQSKSRPTLRRA